MPQQKLEKKNHIPCYHKGITVEALKQSFMDCQPSCTSPLPWIWVIETLACSNQVDLSLLLDLLAKIPEISDDLGRNARELVSLRILEGFFSEGACANSLSSASGQKIILDSSDNCEDVLRRILTETSQSNLNPAGPEMWKWDLQPFIEHKRSSFGKYALRQLKDAILTGSHSFLASLKEQSGLPVGNQHEHVNPVGDGNCNSNTPVLEGGNTKGSYLLHRDLPDENLATVNGKRKSTSENDGGKSSENQILLESGCKTHTKCIKKYKHDISCSEQCLGEKLKSSGLDGQLADTSTVSMQHNEGERCSLGRKTHMGMGLDGPPKDDNDECTASKVLVGHDEVLSREEQVPQTELNNKSNEEQGQDHDTGVTKAGKEDFCDLKSADEEVDKFEPNIQRDVQHVSEVEKDVGISTDSDGNNDDRTDIATKNNSSSSKHEKVLPHEEQSHYGTEVLNGKFDGERGQDHETENVKDDKTGLHELIPANEDMDKSEQNIPRNVPNVGEAEEPVDISSDSDGYHDEKTNIATQKKTFLSSQCTYSQDSLATTDWRELNLCVKCIKGGKLLVCSSNSCPLLIHEGCLGSDANFDTRGKFYCPFCAYSRAISKYMETKKKATLARKDLATFMCLGTQKDPMEQSHRSCRIKQNLEYDDGLPKSNEPNNRNVEHRKKLEYEQARPSELHSGYSPPFGRKAVDSTNRIDDSLNKDKQEGERTKQVSRSSRLLDRMAGKSHDDNTSCPDSERNGSKKHANTKSKKSALFPPETDLPRGSKCSQNSQSADAEDIAEEEDESSGVSKYFIRVRKHEKQPTYPAIPQLRRKRLPWTREEEEVLKEGMRLLCSPHDKVIPWKKILEFGAGTFQRSRCTMDLKDKWRNMCKATPRA